MRIVPHHRCAASAVLAAAGALIAMPAGASSHREAPFITENPKVDATDFYMFRSYEPGREDFVTIVANYLPLQDPYGGPNYFSLDPDALYQIHIDNNGDAVEDVTFRFRFTSTLRNIALNIGGQMVPIPLINAGAIGPAPGANGALNVLETYTAEVIRVDTRPGPGPNGQIYDVPPSAATLLTNIATNQSVFAKPVDNIGLKSIPEYDAYAAAHVYTINIPGCPIPGRMFVGQRKDPFVVNLGETFDLVNTNPLGPPDGEGDDLADKNITSIVLEVPIACLTRANQPVIGGWTTACLRRTRTLLNIPLSFAKPASEQGTFVQVSRLGSPLVNEVVIGLPDKDRFNASRPRDDGQFGVYVTNPTLPALLNILFGVTAPCLPRNDLVQVFLTGVPTLTMPPGARAAEMLRLNTAIPPTPRGVQNPLGVIAGDLAGYPNGRRPGDDSVDISLRAVMGVLLPAACAPDGALPYTDGAFINDQMTDGAFPYLRTPIPGSPAN